MRLGSNSSLLSFRTQTRTSLANKDMGTVHNKGVERGSVAMDDNGTITALVRIHTIYKVLNAPSGHIGG